MPEAETENGPPVKKAAPPPEVVLKHGDSTVVPSLDPV